MRKSRVLLNAKDRGLHSALLFGLLTGMRSGEICGLMAEDIIAIRVTLGGLFKSRPNAIRQLKSKAAEREVPLHQILEQLLDTSLPKQGRLFPYLTVDAVVKRYAKLRRLYPNLQGSPYSIPPASGSSPSASVQAPLSTSRPRSWGIILHVQPTN